MYPCLWTQWVCTCQVTASFQLHVYTSELKFRLPHGHNARSTRAGNWTSLDLNYATSTHDTEQHLCLREYPTIPAYARARALYTRVNVANKIYNSTSFFSRLSLTCTLKLYEPRRYPPLQFPNAGLFHFQPYSDPTTRSWGRVSISEQRRINVIFAISLNYLLYRIIKSISWH